MKLRLQSWVVGSVLALTVAGCAVFEGQQSARSYTDDSAITAKVKAKFVEDPVVSAMRLSVETLNGVVQVSGFAKSAEEERRALQLARSVDGVKSVRDGIEVRSGVQ